MLNEKPNLDSGVLHPIRKDIRSVCHLKMNYVQNTAGGRCVKDIKAVQAKKLGVHVGREKKITRPIKYKSPLKSAM